MDAALLSACSERDAKGGSRRIPELKKRLLGQEPMAGGKKRKEQKELGSLVSSFPLSLSLPPMMVSVIVRDVEGGTACAGAGAEGPAPALSAGSGARKTRWPSIGEAVVFFFFSVFAQLLFLLFGFLLPRSSLARRSVLLLLLLPRALLLLLCSPCEERGRRGGRQREGEGSREQICERLSLFAFQPFVFLVFLHSQQHQQLDPPLLHHHPEVAPRQAPHPPVEPAAPRSQQARQSRPRAAPAAAQGRR